MVSTLVVLQLEVVVVDLILLLIDLAVAGSIVANSAAMEAGPRNDLVDGPRAVISTAVPFVREGLDPPLF
jgi:hypothetical protein